MTFYINIKNWLLNFRNLKQYILFILGSMRALSGEDYYYGMSMSMSMSSLPMLHTISQRSLDPVTIASYYK